jgi:hypothetical protein
LTNRPNPNGGQTGAKARIAAIVTVVTAIGALIAIPNDVVDLGTLLGLGSPQAEQSSTTKALPESATPPAGSIPAPVPGQTTTTEPPATIADVRPPVDPPRTTTTKTQPQPQPQTKKYLREAYVRSNAVNTNAALTIQGTDYPDSLTIGCVWSAKYPAIFNTAGYSRIETMIGVHDSSGESEVQQNIPCIVTAKNEAGAEIWRDEFTPSEPRWAAELCCGAVTLDDTYIRRRAKAWPGPKHQRQRRQLCSSWPPGIFAVVAGDACHGRGRRDHDAAA